MNQPFKKLLSYATALLLFALVVLLALAFTRTQSSRAPNPHLGCKPGHHVCVMKTIFNLEDGAAQPVSFDPKTLPADVRAAIGSGLAWMSGAQLPDGGWGAGLYTRQDIRDPHAVPSDPATTAVVLLALLRTGNTLDSGQYRQQVVRGTALLLNQVEAWPAGQPRLTTLSGTQPQRKLGENIDAILTVQYLTTLLKTQPRHPMKSRIEQALQTCVARIEKEQDSDGGWKGGGWAPVLQSALADQALESAQDLGIQVDSTVMLRSKTYQKSNFDTATRSAVTGKAAGVMLYSLSSTTRSSAREAKKAKVLIEAAKQEGKVNTGDKVSEATLVQAGATPAEAKQLETAFRINEITKVESTRTEVMEGFGSNGGEELLSYLMTGESMALQDVQEWTKWYAAMSKKIISIQQRDGSWEGHHCITSPVFCTAAALLILSIQQDLSPVKTGF